MTSKEQLLKHLELFLQTPRATETGDWPIIYPGEVRKLQEIVEEIIELKFGRDDGMDLPIDVDLLDRTRFDCHAGRIPLKYTYKAETPEDLDDIIESATCNAMSSMEKLSAAIKIKRHNANTKKGTT